MKGGKTRTRAVPPALNLAIDRYLDFRAAAVGTVRDAITGPLLVTRRGKRINRFEVYRFVRRAATAAGIASANEISPHSFRHAWAAIARERGATLEERQFALGHADPRTTQRYDRARQSLDRDPSYLVAAATAMED
jgi:integrase